MAMPGGGGGHRQPTNSTSAGGGSGSLLLSPPSSRSFPFRDGSAYLESALLVPYDDEGGGASSANVPQDTGGVRESFAGTTSNYFGSSFPQSNPTPPLNANNASAPFSRATPPLQQQQQFPPPPPPLTHPEVSSFDAFSSTCGSAAYINRPPQHPYLPNANAQLLPPPPPPPIANNNNAPPTSSYFNPYSSSSPVLPANNTLPFAPAAEQVSFNPYARSAIIGQQPVMQMTTGELPSPPTYLQTSPDTIDMSADNQWPQPALTSPISPMAVQEQQPQMEYVPVHPHWFYCKEVEKKQVWFPFSLLDSMHLEEVYNRVDHQDDQSMIVATDGGRYDVYIHDRVRCAIYWDEEPLAVRRASWFYRLDRDRAFLPYEEHFSEKLEEEYSVAVTTNTWHRRLEFPEGETVVIHNPQVIVHYKPANVVDWEGATESQMKPRIVRRGMDDAEIVDDGEAMQIDHLVFVVHGIGAICDLKFRTLPEAVGDFRMIANGLLASHFRNHVESGRVGRVEFLPVSWHNFLHGDATGIDEKLKPITLKSIPKLRYFANDTILDVLFYTSPVYCQAIVNQVSSEMNRIHGLFLRRNPSFSGKVSLAGHSLGSVILFDLLCHQPPSIAASREKSVNESGRSSTELRSPTPNSVAEKTLSSEADTAPDTLETKLTAKRPSSLEDALLQLGLEEYNDVFNKERMDLDALVLCGEDDLKGMGIPLGPRKKFLALLHEMQEDHARQGCGDLAAHSSVTTQADTPSPPPSGRRRKASETMIHYVVGMAGTGHPCVIYPRLDFQPTCFFAMGSPVAMFLTIRGHDTVWDSYQLPNCPAYYNIFHPFDPVAYRMEPLIDPSFTTRPVLVPHHKGRKRMHLEIKESLSRVGADLKQKVVESLRTTWNTINEFARAHRANTAQVEAEVEKIVDDELRLSRKSSQGDYDLNSFGQDQREEDLAVGRLNGGRRIDYVLQEKPIESFNEYLFALQSHTCYWESEDTVLLMLKEIYSSYGIHPTFQGVDPHAKSLSNSRHVADQQRQSSTTAVGGWQDNRPSLAHAPASTDHFTMTSTVGTDPHLHGPGVSPTGMNPSIPPTSYGGVTSSSSAPPPLSGFVKQSALRK